MSLFPKIPPLGVENPQDWTISGNEEALLAQEENNFEKKLNEIRNSNDGNFLGKSVENEQEEYEPDADDEEADNVEEESEGEEFEQEPV